MAVSWLNALAPAAFAAIPAAGIAQLTSTAVAGLDAAHVQALSIGQITSLKSHQSLSVASVAGLTGAQVGAISVSWGSMSGTWLNALSDAAFAAIPASEIAALQAVSLSGVDARHIADLTTTQIAALTTSQVAALTTSQIAALTPADIAALSTSQLAALTTAQIGALSASQFAALRTTQTAALTPAQVAALNASSLIGLGAAQPAAFDANIRYLSPSAIAKLPVSLILQMSCAQLSDLAPGQIAALSAQQIAALSSAQLAVVQQAGSWVSKLLGNLSAAGILTQVQAVLNTGASLFTYDALLKVLNGVDAAVGSAGLSQAQMSDLKALTTAVGSSEGYTSYLYQMLNNTVNGNGANATWTGGGATSTTLGNLAVGSSAAQLGRLSSKWFLGLDLPTWSSAGAADYKVTYAPLFNVSGPLASDVSQGGVGDCYLMAALVEIAQDEPALLKSMFTDNGNGTYGVRFYADDHSSVYVTVNEQLPGWVGSSATNDNWVALLEKAFVEFDVTVYGSTNDYSSIDGGWSNGLNAVSGKDNTNYMSYQYQTRATWDGTPKASVIRALGAGEEVMFASFMDSKDVVNGRTDLVSSHMFAVEGYDSANDEFILRNPWGNSGGSGWNGVFELSMDQLWGGTSGSSSSSGFIVASGAAPIGAIDPKYAVSQLIQAMASAAVTSAAETSNFSAAQPQLAILLAASAV